MKIEQPLVSVIMGVYDTRLCYLKKAVESVVNQTYSNIEFVIIDDGSSRSDVKEYLRGVQQEDDRIRLIVNSGNIGLTRSLNVGLDNAHGDYIARMDSDDISQPDRIRKQVEYMEAHRDVCMTGTEVLIISDKDEHGEVVSRGHMSDQRVCDIHLLYENEGYAHSTFMLRKSFLDDNMIRYREEIKRAQDYALTTDIILAGGKRYLLSEALLKYRIHDDNISAECYREQVEYQAQTGFRRLRATFQSLSEEECWAIARINHESREYAPKVIISAIKKMFAENGEKGIFEPILFKREFYYEWYKKAMRISRLIHRPWGLMTWFFVKAIPSVVIVKARNRFG